jgi:replication factor A1
MKGRAILLRSLQRETLRYGRGRPRGHRQSMAEATRLWYLIRVSEKYGLEPRRFLTCFLDAWVRGKSSYNGMLIQCRRKTESEGVFLVTQDQKVIAQLSLGEPLLKRLPDVDLECFPSVPAKKIEAPRTVDIQIKDIRSGIKCVNLKARVVEKSITKGIFSKFGNHLTLSTATISDSTGSIKLPLWNSQIDMVSVGDTVEIENGRVRSFRGELQVSVGKNSKLKVLENRSK